MQKMKVVILVIVFFVFFVNPIQAEFLEINSTSVEENKFIPDEILVQYKSDNSPQELQDISQNAYLYSLNRQLDLIDKLSEDKVLTPTNTDKSVLGINSDKLFAQQSVTTSHRSKALPANFNAVATLKNIAQSKERFISSYLQENQLNVKSFSKSPLTKSIYYQYKVNNATNISQTISELQNLEEISIAQVNYLYHTLKVPNDPEYSKLWGMKKIQTEAAWDTFTGSKAAVKIAVIDQLPNLSHPDLADNVAKYKNMCSSGGASGGHGNHVSGTIGAVGNNSKGVAGINWEAAIEGFNVDCNGQLPGSVIVKSIDEAVADGVKVINMSLGGPANEADQLFRDAIKRAIDAGVLVVVSAGNCGSSPSARGCGNPPREISADNLFPANDPNVFTVAATDQNDERAGFSSKGASVDITAPGVGIISTWIGGGYQSSSGTSMSSPHVAGLATLIFARNPSLSASQVRQIIVDTADDLGTPGRDDVHGAGRINVKAALSDPRVSSGQTQPTLAVSQNPVASTAPSIPPTISLRLNSPAPQPTLVLPKLDVTPGVVIKIPLPTPSGAKAAVESFTFFEPCNSGFQQLEYQCSDGKTAKLTSSECQSAEVHLQKAINACAEITNDQNPTPTNTSTQSTSHIELIDKGVSGNERRVGVLIDSGGENISGTDVVLNYDPQFLNIKEVLPVNTKNFLEFTRAKFSIPGSIYISAIASDAAKVIKGRGEVADIILTNVTSQAKMDIYCVPGTISDDSNIAKNSPEVPDIINCSKNTSWENKSGSSSGNININFLTRLQGVTTPVEKSIKVQVGVGGGKLEEPVFQFTTITHESNGVYRGKVSFNLPEGENYSFFIKGPVHQRRKFCQNDPREIFKGVYTCVEPKLSLQDGVNDLDFSKIHLLVGDLPNSDGEQDGIVNSRDIAQLRSAIDLEDANIAYCDLNFDGRCNATDWALLIAALSVKGDEN